MRGTTDRELVSAARNGDGVAYGELFERYHARVYNYAYSIVGNAEDAGDIAQEAFVRVFEALPRTSDDLNFSAYTYRTAHNIAVDQARARSRFVPPDALDLEREPALRADPEKVALLKEQQERTWRAAFELTDAHREILTLRELHDMSYQEIAEVLDMPRNTVGVLLSRARLKFKEAFRMSSVDAETLAEECAGMLPLLSARIDAELTAEQETRVSHHLADCAFCRLALEEMTEASASYRGLLPLLPSLAAEERAWAAMREFVAPDEAYGAEFAPDEGATPSVASRPRYTHRSALLVASGAALVTFLAMLVWSAVTGEVSITDTSPSVTEQQPSGQPADLAPLDATLDERQQAPEEGPTTGSDEPAESEPAAAAVADTEAPATPRQVSPANGATLKSSFTTLRWDASDDPSGVSYVIEIERWDDGAKAYIPAASVEVAGTSVDRDMAADHERWRVRAIDGAGNESATSGWWEYGLFVVILPPETYVPDDPPELY